MWYKFTLDNGHEIIGEVKDDSIIEKLADTKAAKSAAPFVVIRKAAQLTWTRGDANGEQPSQAIAPVGPPKTSGEVYIKVNMITMILQMSGTTSLAQSLTQHYTGIQMTTTMPPPPKKGGNGMFL